jgi:hypothetical protein
MGTYEHCRAINLMNDRMDSFVFLSNELLFKFVPLVD